LCYKNSVYLYNIRKKLGEGLIRKRVKGITDMIGRTEVIYDDKKRIFPFGF
jgi:hypothetical protein